jgi:hypothetical protein
MFCTFFRLGWVDIGTVTKAEVRFAASLSKVTKRENKQLAIPGDHFIIDGRDFWGIFTL